MKLARTAAVTVAILASASASRSAWAQTAEPPRGDRLQWNEAWPRVQPAEYALTGALVAGAIAIEYGTEQPDQPRWHGPVLFDGVVRDGFVGDPVTRRRADIASDALWLTAQWYSTVIDAGLVAGVGERNADVSGQMAAMNVEALALTFVVTRSVQRLAARGRPMTPSCRSDEGYDPLCPFPGANASFFSGHTSMSFAGAGLTCVHHRFLPLYGGGAADTAACAGVSALAGVTGLLRIAADRHYATDVLAGAIVGFGIGYGLPYLLHYRHGGTAQGTETARGPAAMGVERPPPGPTFAFAGRF